MRFLRKKSIVLVVLVAVASLLVSSCSSNDEVADNSNVTSSEVDGGEVTSDVVDDEVEGNSGLASLVSNDDGYGAEGIDRLVEAIRAMPNVEVIVAAPLTQQSGQGSNVTEGELTVTEVTTMSGHPADAVDGFPADSVNWALDGNIEFTGGATAAGDDDLTRPHVIITGINHGQNVGQLADQVSGTVGAARAGAVQGIPGLATSLGISLAEGHSYTADYDSVGAFVVEWLEGHREALLDGTAAQAPVLLENFNYPSCLEGSSRGLIEIDVSDILDNGFIEQDCTSELTDPTDDVAALNNGFATLSTLPIEQFTTSE